MKSIYNSKLNIKLPEHIQFAIEMLDDSTKSKFYFLINAILDCLPKDKVKIMHDTLIEFVSSDEMYAILLNQINKKLYHDNEV
jgi:hypothetical protein